MKQRYPGLLAVIAATSTLAVAQADEAGSVIFAKGDVTAEREPPVALAKGDAVLETDEIVTGEASRAQLLMIDGAKIAIRPSSRLRIDEYAWTDPAAGASVSTRDDTSVMSLVKGGFRTLSGAIADEEPGDYEVRTPVGVLGIRGTDYSAMFCNGDCASGSGAAVADGLYLGVTAGTIEFSTATETIVLDAGEYAFIPLAVPEPRRLDEPPPVLLEENSFTPDGQATGARAGSFDAKLGARRAPDAAGTPQPGDGDPRSPDEAGEPPKQPTIATDPDGSVIDITPGDSPDPQGPRTIGYAGSELTTLGLRTTAIGDNPADSYSLGSGNLLERFEAPVGGRLGGDVVTFDIGTAANVESGFDSVTVLRWGRWANGDIRATFASTGVSEPVSLANSSLHWISGPEGAPPTMPVTGTATYSLVGATSPTDNLGNVGVLGDATFQANFTSMLVDTTVSLDIAGSNWTGSGTGTIGAQAGLPAHQFQGLYDAVVIDGVTGGSGTFAGFFSEPGTSSDPAIPGGVGLTYTLSDPQGAMTVSGALAFGNP